MKKKNPILFLIFIIALLFCMGCNPVEQALLRVDTNQCTGCAQCFNVCKSDAIRIINNKAVIDPTKCIKCGSCIEICPENAIF